MATWEDLKAGKPDTPDRFKEGVRTLIATIEGGGKSEGDKRAAAGSLEDVIAALYEALGGDEVVKKAQDATLAMVETAGGQQAAHMALMLASRAITDMLKKSESAPAMALDMLAVCLEGCATELRKAAKDKSGK
jgi:hypothetical protein